MADVAPKGATIATAGEPQAGIPPFHPSVINQQNSEAEPAEPAATPAGTPPAPGTVATAVNPPAADAIIHETEAPDITNEQLSAYFKKQGIEGFEDIEKLKEKLKPTTPAAPLTPEQIKAKEIAHEKRLLDLHIERGGTTESFVKIKGMMAADIMQLAIERQKEEMIADGVKPEKIDKLIKKMNFDVSEEDYEMMSDEEKAEIDEERNYGKKQFEKLGLNQQKIAKTYWDSLNQEANDVDAENALIAQHSSKVEEAIAKFQRKQVLQLGEYNGQQLSPVEYEFSEDTLTEVKELLHDPVKLRNLIFNQDGTFNVDFLLPHIANSVSRGTLVKHVFLTGGTRQVEKLRGVFDATPPNLGAVKTAANANGKGNLVKAGQPQVGTPFANK